MHFERTDPIPVSKQRIGGFSADAIVLSTRTVVGSIPPPLPNLLQPMDFPHHG